MQYTQQKQQQQRTVMLLGTLALVFSLASTLVGCRACGSPYDYSNPLTGCGECSTGCETGGCGCGSSSKQHTTHRRASALNGGFSYHAGAPTVVHATPTEAEPMVEVH